MTQILTAKEGWQWVKHHFRRKWTVWIHVVTGAFCGVLFHWYPGLAVLCFIMFAIFEKWQYRAEQDEGWLDLWDGIFGLFLGAIVLFLLNLSGVL